MAHLTKSLFSSVPVCQHGRSLAAVSRQCRSVSTKSAHGQAPLTTVGFLSLQKRHKFSFQDGAGNDDINFSSQSGFGGGSNDFDIDFDSVSSSRMGRGGGGGGGMRGGMGGGMRMGMDRGGRGQGGGMQRRSAFQRQQIQWNQEELTPFRKDFYKEHPSVAAMSESEIKRMREELNMVLFGNDIPKPFKTFEESGIPSQCLTHLDQMGIAEPSAIQQQGIPMALSGRDIVGISRTGSGKTLAYLLPAIVHIQAQPVVQRGEGPIGLVLAPTRELTLQISNEISKYVATNSHIQLKHCAVFGGADRNRQISQLRQSPDLLVATPGRLLDLLECQETNFKRCTYLVLDEADRMLDMGFRDDLETILSYVRPDRQVLMWSATWPKEIQQIAKNYMTDPIRVQIGSTDLHANPDIEQTFRYINNPRAKTAQFMQDMSEIASTGKKCLVFANTKRGADMLENQLTQNNVRARAIHGDKTQAARENILGHFRENKIQVLIATDVVARGIDIRDIEVVLVYDMPTNLEDYVHRIGRTARGGDKGISLGYVTSEDVSRFGSKLITLLKKSKQEIPKWLGDSSW